MPDTSILPDNHYAGWLHIQKSLIMPYGLFDYGGTINTMGASTPGQTFATMCVRAPCPQTEGNNPMPPPPTPQNPPTPKVTCTGLTMRPPAPPAGCKNPQVVYKPDPVGQGCPPIWAAWKCDNIPTNPTTMCVRAPCPQTENSPGPAAPAPIVCPAGCVTR